MANEMLLKYGCNPNQKPSRVFMEEGKDLPIQVLNGKPGYINLLDAFNGWQLVRELKKATGMCAATSFTCGRCYRQAFERGGKEDIFC